MLRDINDTARDRKIKAMAVSAAIKSNIIHSFVLHGIRAGGFSSLFNDRNQHPSHGIIIE